MADLSTGQDGYRPRRYYLIVGIVGAIFYSTMAIVSVVAAYWNIDGSFARPLLAAIIFGTFWCAMLLLVGGHGVARAERSSIIADGGSSFLSFRELAMSVGRVVSGVKYPESDGKPTGETDLHRDWMVRILEVLRQRYCGRATRRSCCDCRFATMGCRHRRGKYRAPSRLSIAIRQTVAFTLRVKIAKAAYVVRSELPGQHPNRRRTVFPRL